MSSEVSKKPPKKMKLSLEELQDIVRKRAQSGDPESWTAQLVESGMEGATKKLGEEAVETIIAACSENKEQTKKEAADLLYHLIVVLYIKDVDIEDVLEELGRRTNMSGVAEKKSRKNKTDK